MLFTCSSALALKIISSYPRILLVTARNAPDSSAPWRLLAPGCLYPAKGNETRWTRVSSSLTFKTATRAQPENVIKTEDRPGPGEGSRGICRWRLKDYLPPHPLLSSSSTKSATRTLRQKRRKTSGALLTTICVLSAHRYLCIYLTRKPPLSEGERRERVVASLITSKGN